MLFKKVKIHLHCHFYKGAFERTKLSSARPIYKLQSSQIDYSRHCEETMQTPVPTAFQIQIVHISNL